MRTHVVIQTADDNYTVAYHTGYVAVTECSDPRAAQREADRLNLEEARKETARIEAARDNKPRRIAAGFYGPEHGDR
jgi:hypothetical protein